MAPGWALAREDGEAALRTPSWFFRSIREEDAHRRQLYAKPDDRHEANEVSSRAASVVEACQGFTERLAGDLHLQTRPVIAFPDDIL
jgi:hypothetical protein